MNFKIIILIVASLAAAVMAQGQGPPPGQGGQRPACNRTVTE